MSTHTWHRKTLLAQIGIHTDPTYGSVSPPIYPTVTFQHGPEGLGPFDYSRTDNPTRAALANALTVLEGGAGSSLFSSGMAAIQAVAATLSQGDHVVLTEDVYGGTYRLFEDTFSKFGVATTYVNTRNLSQVRAAMRPTTRLVFIESPSNPLLQISDIKAIAEIAHEFGALLAVDNTFMTFIRQRPLHLGADLVVYSATKYLGGHNDVLAGAVIARDPEVAESIATIANACGGVLSPLDSWLLMRGLKTLALRFDQQEATARRIAQFLDKHPRVVRVYYPDLGSNADTWLHQRQAEGPGAMVSFQLPMDLDPAKFSARLQCVLPAVSLGGVESLLTHPYTETHRELPEALRLALGIRPGLMRLSVGIEHTEDILRDLETALAI